MSVTLRRGLYCGVGCLLAACAALILSRATPTRAEEPAAKNGEAAKEDKDHPKFVRVVHDKDGEPEAMETAIVHYVPADGGDGATVDLIAAVHVGEKSYYDTLNKKFEKYDALLYELVAAKNAAIPKPGEKSHSAVSAIQTAMKDFLDLEFQLDCIDYTKKNFVHADMSPAEFAKSMSDKGESIWSILFRMMAAGMAQQGSTDDSDVDLIMALFDKHRAILLKRYMADQMGSLEGAMAGLEGPNGSTLVTERNKAALKVLASEIKAGKKQIGIFYGAGHFSDMDKRLTSEFGLKRSGEVWLEAWNLRLPEQKGKPAAEK